MGMSATAIRRETYRYIVIGGGHNGLACASYLARSGHSVLVLEAGERLGGMAITREFAPGFRASAGAHLLNQMPERLIADLSLEQHGLHWAARAIPTVALSEASAPLMFGRGAIAGIDQPGDARAYAEFDRQMGRFARALAPLLTQAPPRLGTAGWADRLSLLQTGWRLRWLGRRDMRDLLRIGGMNAYDLLHDQFQSPLLQGAIGLDAVLGSNLGPRSPGTVLTLLYRLATQHGSGAHGVALPRGGMGAVAEALAAAARHAGAEICTGAQVTRVLVQGDRACGVRLASGREVAAATVISSADPKTSLIGLVGAEHLDAGFVRQVSHLRTQGAAAKLHLALSGLPTFSNLPTSAHGARLLVAPSLDYLEHAYNHSKYSEYSQSPALEIMLPSVHDASLAPPGQHVLSAVVQYAPYRIAGGWDTQRERFTERLIDTIARYAPGVRRLVLASELLTPEDLEREFRVRGGHWHHEDLALDQFYMVRPVPGAAQYATPLPGYYLCGASCHPGGGVMGLAGRNAARRILAEAA
jgi:phytoene dehydrogenase-like protein